jgi:hypothetical protein
MTVSRDFAATLGCARATWDKDKQQIVTLFILIHKGED